MSEHAGSEDAAAGDALCCPFPFHSSDPALQTELDAYLKHLQNVRQCSPCTIRCYRQDLAAAVAFFLQRLGDRAAPTEQLTAALCRDWIAELGRRGLAPASVCRALSSLRSWCKWLRRRRVIAGDPLVGVHGPRLVRRLPYVPGREDVERLLDAPPPYTVAGVRDRSMMTLLYCAGLRVSELTGLNLADLALDEGKVKVMGKGRKPRVAFLGPVAVGAMQAWLSLRPAYLADDAGDAPLFVGHCGTRLTTHAVGRHMAAWVATAGLDPRLTPHKLRHAFTTHQLENGADLVALSRMLGHENLATTAIYAHVSPVELRKTFLSGHPRARRQTKEGNANG
jgi:integrase/recombinase XerC